MKRTNIKDKLKAERDKFISGEELLSDIKTILAEDNAVETAIKKQIAAPREGGNAITNDFNLDLLHSDHIYHTDQLKRICTIYRLRFLDSHYFKDELPYEALRKTKHLQKAHETTLKGFKILAPEKAFRLKNADDPLLFAPIGNGYYYLIHKWGRDLSPWRKLMMWPFRNLECMIGFLFVLSILLTAIFPKDVFSTHLTGPEFFIIVFFMFKWVGGLAIFYLFKKGKNFSPAVWRSPYFN